jgi:hypothetical protein
MPDNLTATQTKALLSGLLPPLPEGKEGGESESAGVGEEGEEGEEAAAARWCRLEPLLEAAFDAPGLLPGREVRRAAAALFNDIDKTRDLCHHAPQMALSYVSRGKGGEGGHDIKHRDAQVLFVKFQHMKNRKHDSLICFLPRPALRRWL